MKAIIIFYPDRENEDENTIENGVFEREKVFTKENLEEEFNIKLICFIPLEVKGKTYAERKADLQDKAIEWSNSWNLGGDWHFSNIIEIDSFFEEQGERNGYEITEEDKQTFEEEVYISEFHGFDIFNGFGFNTSDGAERVYKIVERGINPTERDLVSFVEHRGRK